MSPPGYEIKKSNELKGLGVFATRSFKESDIVFQEKPLVCAQFSWNETYGYSACHHCLRHLETVEENIQRLTGNPNMVLPFPDLGCTDKSQHRFCEMCGIAFCSKECKSIALEEYHNTICPRKLPSIILLCEKWKQMHYPPETAAIMLIAKIIAMIEQAELKDELLLKLLNFSHGSPDEDRAMLFKILGEDKLKILHNQLIQSLPSRHAKILMTEDGMTTLFAIIGRNGQGIGSSVFSHWIQKIENQEMSDEDKEKVDQFVDNVYQAMDEHSGTFLNSEGSGLYEMQRCINHSCSPNAIVTFPYSNSILAIKAKKDINPGEEICISYLDDCVLERSRHSRNKFLRDYYMFECQCEKCQLQADDPDVTSEEEEEEDEDDDDDDMEC